MAIDLIINGPLDTHTEPNYYSKWVLFTQGWHTVLIRAEVKPNRFLPGVYQRDSRIINLVRFRSERDNFSATLIDRETNESVTISIPELIAVLTIWR